MHDVTVAYLHSDEVGHNFHTSLLHTVMYDAANDRRITEMLPSRCSSNGLVAGRNHTVATFLDHTAGDWLWWIDADMGWKPDTLDRLLAAADPQAAPVVGALCFAWNQIAPDGLGGFQQIARPTIYQWVDMGEHGHRFKSVDTYPEGELVRCAATGSAMIVLHRSALEAVRAEHGDRWYDRLPTSAGDGFMGEDISLCARLGGLGIPVHVDTRIHTNHLKTIYVGEGHHLSAYS